MKWSTDAKMLVLGAIAPVKLQLFEAKHWIASFDGDVSLRRGPGVTSCMGRGSTPVRAVNDLWEVCTSLARGAERWEYVEKGAFSGNAKAHKWNGATWMVWSLPEVKPDDRP